VRRISDGHVSNFEERVWGYVAVCHFHVCCLCSPAVLLLQWMQLDNSELFPSEGILDMRHGCDFKWMTNRMTNIL
jgi:hypothetical protein